MCTLSGAGRRGQALAQWAAAQSVAAVVHVRTNKATCVLAHLCIRYHHTSQSRAAGALHWDRTACCRSCCCRVGRRRSAAAPASSPAPSARTCAHKKASKKGTAADWAVMLSKGCCRFLPTSSAPQHHRKRGRAHLPFTLHVPMAYTTLPVGAKITPVAGSCWSLEMKAVACPKDLGGGGGEGGLGGGLGGGGLQETIGYGKGRCSLRS